MLFRRDPVAGARPGTAAAQAKNTAAPAHQHQKYHLPRAATSTQRHTVSPCCGMRRAAGGGRRAVRLAARHTVSQCALTALANGAVQAPAGAMPGAVRFSARSLPAQGQQPAPLGSASVPPPEKPGAGAPATQSGPAARCSGGQAAKPPAAGTAGAPSPTPHTAGAVSAAARATPGVRASPPPNHGAQGTQEAPKKDAGAAMTEPGLVGNADAVGVSAELVTISNTRLTPSPPLVRPQRTTATRNAPPRPAPPASDQEASRSMRSPEANGNTGKGNAEQALAARDTVAELENQVATLQKQLHAASVDLHGAAKQREDALTAEQHANAELHQARQQVQAMQAERDKAMEQLIAAREDAEKRHAECEQHQRDLVRIGKQKEDFELNLLVVEKEVQLLRDEHERLSKAKKQDYSNELQSLKDHITAAEQRANGASTERDALQKLLRNLETNNEQNIKKYKRQAQAAQTEAARAARDLDAALLRQRELESVPAELKTRIQTLLAEIQNLEEGKCSVESKLQQIEQEKTLLAADKDALMKELLAAQQHLETNRQGMALLEQQLEEHASKCAAMEKEVEKSQVRERESTSRSERDRAALEMKLEGEVQGRSEESTEHKLRLQVADEQVAHLKAQLETREEELTVVQRKISGLETRAAMQSGEQEAQLASLKKQLADEQATCRTEMAQKESKVQARTAAMEEAHQQQLRAVEDRLQRQEQATSEANAKLQEARSELQAMQQDLQLKEDLLQGNAAKAQEQFEARELAIREDSERAVKLAEAKLQIALEQSGAEKRAQDAEMASARHLIRALENDQQLSQQETQGLYAALGVISVESDSLESTAADFEETVHMLVGMLQVLTAQSKEDLAQSQQKTKTLKDALTIAQNERSKMEQERDALQRNFSAAQVEMTALKDALTIAQNERSSKEQDLDALQRDFSAAQAKMAEKLQMAQRADQEHRSVAASDRANAQKRIERAAEQLQEAMQERQALEQQLAKQQRFAETRAQSQAAQMEHMQSKLNEMLEKLEQVQRENLEMAEQVHNFSRLVEGEEASRKIIAAQSAAQENAIANMHAQRKELNGQLEDANRRLSDAAAELKRLSGQQAKMNALEEQLQHLQAVESRAKMQIQQADERCVRAHVCACVRVCVCVCARVLMSVHMWRRARIRQCVSAITALCNVSI